MRKMKRWLAAALAVTMVMGSSLTAFAADNSGSATGDGSSEGHVEKKATNVVLPTIPEGGDTTTFKYTMDPERLISGTSGKKYEDGTVFPAADADTGVYFLTADKKYENASKKLKVVNQSSHDISLTVKAETVNAATDIPLVAKDAVASADKASLYLGLVVGTEAGVALTKDTAATKTVTVAGKPANFKVDVKTDKSGYEYRPLTLDEYKALDGNSSATEIAWASEEFQLEGSVAKKDVDSTTTAPKVKVTWSWVDPSASAAPSITTTTYSYTAGTAIEIPVDLGKGDLKATRVSSVTFTNADGGQTELPTTRWTYADGKLTFTGEYCGKIGGGTRIHKVIFDDTAKTTVTVTLNPASN